MFRGGFPLHVCFLSCPHHTDVSKSRSYCDVNHCDADASLFDRLRSLWVLSPPPSPFRPHANCGRCRRSVHSYPTPREQTANSDPSRKFSAPISLDPGEVALHTSSGDCPPTKTGEHALYSAHIQSQHKSIGSDIENGVERG